MIVVTMITDLSDNGYSNFFLPSCLKNSLSLKVLVQTNGVYSTHRQKDQLLLKFLSQYPDEICLFSDGYDAMFVSGEAEIVSKFLKFGRKIVFSAETACWPDSSLKNAYPEVSSPYRYLNSGGFIGYSRDILACLKEGNSIKDDRYPWSNQYFWTINYLKDLNSIAIDTKCDIFNTFSPEVGFRHLVNGRVSPDYTHTMAKWFKRHFHLKNGRLFNTYTSTFPSHLHFNGYSKCLMDNGFIPLNFNKGKWNRDMEVIML